MLLKAIDSDDKLPDAFTELDCTGNLTVDMEEFKLHMINKASLYDGKENFLKRGKKKISINHTEQFFDALSEEEVIEAYRTTRTPGNPEARMPEEIFRAMNPSNRSDWTKIPEETRLVLVKLLNSGKSTGSIPAQSRRAYAHDFELAPEQAGHATNDDFEGSSVPLSDISADTHLVRSIQDLLVNASKQRDSISKHTATTQ